MNVLQKLFQRDFKNYEGVPRINIYSLRVLFFLMFVFLSFSSWSVIFQNDGTWGVLDAVAWCMFGSYSAISIIGILRPLKMLPIVLFMIIYKVTWLMAMAYPLWIKGELIGSSAEGMARIFIWVVFPILIMPWKYFFRTYLFPQKKESNLAGSN